MRTNDNHPLVSIITVVYNGAKTIEQTILSVINQTYKNVEYIIIDGGSADETLSIVKKYEKHISKWISEPDNGLYAAMNKGIGFAKGALIGMINSDDWYELDAVTLMVQEYLNNPDKTLFHADRYDVLPDGSKSIYKYNPSVFKFLYYGMTYNHPSMFITRSEYNKHLYDTDFKGVSDYKFIMETFLEDYDRIHYLEKTIVNFRLGGISASFSIIGDFNEGMRMRKKLNLSLLKRGLYTCTFFTVRAIISFKNHIL